MNFVVHSLNYVWPKISPKITRIVVIVKELITRLHPKDDKIG
jgi:hypothetical protein